jgi:hypothetical protein
VSRCGQDSSGACPPAGFCRTQQRRSGGDEVIKYDRGMVADVTNDSAPGDNSFTPSLFNERHGHAIIRYLCEILRKKVCRRKMFRPAPVESILKGHKVVDFNGDDPVRRKCLEQFRDVSIRHRIARLRAPVLSSIGEVRRDRGNSSGTRIFQRPDQAQ